jgi:predicted lipoprotein with Yx(FWY)xxD motif
MTRTRTAALLAASALGISLLSACGSGSGSSPKAASHVNDQGGQGGGQRTGPDTALSAREDPPVRLAARQIDKLGIIVTDSNGMTLYRFDNDTAQPPVANCNGPCATLWPPLLTTTGSVQLSGIDQTLVGTTTRQDGSIQLTIAGWPMYRYAKDTAAGDAKGQGVGGTWFASTPQGKKATATSGAESGNGYGY